MPMDAQIHSLAKVRQLSVPAAVDYSGARHLLATHGWLATSSPAFREALLDICEWRHFDEGDVCFGSDDATGEFFGIAVGCLASTHRWSGNGAEIVHVWHPGEWTSEAPLVSDTPRLGPLVARTAGLLAVVPAQSLSNLLMVEPAFWQDIARQCDQRGFAWATAALDLLRRDSDQRCIASLLRLAGCRFRDPPGGPPYLAPISQQELAEASNQCRNGVSPVLRQLEAAGEINVGYRRIVILNSAALRARLDR
jgi:CRP/FNR family cyclic AMP-dependent transcriptional regulator